MTAEGKADSCAACRRRERRRAERKRRPAEAAEMGAAVRRQVAGLAARAAGGDTEPLVALYALSRDVDAALTAGVIAARAAGHTWETIAGELGISKQAVHQRYGRAVAAATAAAS